MDFITSVAVIVLSLGLIQPATSITPALILTPLIQGNKTSEARERSIVKPSLFLNKTSHSGYLTVDSRYNSNTFFWFFPVEDKPVDKTPWIVWLQGGPGGSSLVGLFDEIGPFQYVNGELKGRKYAWTNEYSVLFIDNPVGAGYSFTDSELGYARNSTTYSNHLYSALQQFLTIFPELRKAPLFLAGESYAGRYVPALATRILKERDLGDEWMINLQGLIMGNPVMDRDALGNYTEIYHQWGLIDSQGVLAAKPLQDQYWQAVQQGNSQAAYQLKNELLDKLSDIAMAQNSYNLLIDKYSIVDFQSYLSREAVSDALHVGLIPFHVRNATVMSMLVPDFLSPVQAEVEKLLDKYKILIYCGQLDLTAPCVPNAEARRRKWHWSKREEFLNAPRVPWWREETVAGYVKSGGNLMEALIRGAGHLAPIDKPAETLQLISSFIKDLEMELPPNFNKNDITTSPVYYPDKEVFVTPSSGDNKNKTETPKINSDASGNKSDITGNKSDVMDNKSEGMGNKSEVMGNKSDILVNQSEGMVNKIGGVAAGTVVSIVLNVILFLLVVFGAFFYYRLKRKSEDFFYNTVDNNSEELFLT